MSINKKKINCAIDNCTIGKVDCMNDIEKLITDEKYNLELKEQVSFEEPKKYLKAVSSFANGYDIGYVIFGVEDGTKRIVGVKDIKKSYEEVANRIKTRIDPSIIPTIDIVNIQGKDLIVVKVIPGQHTPYYYVNKGTRIAYIRKGDQDCETNSTELNELILRGRNQGWDELVTDNLYKDFTFEKLKKYFKDIKDYKIEKEDLESFGLLSGEKLTNAALLYSDQNPVVGSFISCTRWNGLDKLSAKDDIEFYGSILNQIDNAMEFIKKHMSNGWVKEGGKLARRTIPEYDLDAMREALINCIVHQDLNATGNIVVRRTETELTFSNPGMMLVSKQQYFKGGRSICRNPTLQKMFMLLGKAEKAGSGVVKILAGWKELGWDTPILSEEVQPDYVVLTLPIGKTHQENPSRRDKTHQEGGKPIKKTHQETINKKDIRRKQIKEFCSEPRTFAEIMDLFKLKDRVNFKKRYIDPMIAEGLLAMTIPDNPTNKNQQYVSTN